MNDESIEQGIRNYDLFKWLFALFLALLLAILLLQGCLSQNAPLPELNAPSGELVAGEPITLSGVGDVSYDVAVLANNKRIGVANVGDDGSWSLTTKALSRAGDYEITLQAIDDEGNQVALMDDAVLLTLIDDGAAMTESVSEPMQEETESESDSQDLVGEDEDMMESEEMMEDSAESTSESTMEDDDTASLETMDAGDDDNMAENAMDEDESVMMMIQPPTIEAVDVTVTDDGRRVEVRGTADPQSDLRLLYENQDLGIVSSDDAGDWTWTGIIDVMDGASLLVEVLDDTGTVMAISPVYPLVINDDADAVAMEESMDDEDDSAAMSTDSMGTSSIMVSWPTAEQGAVAPGSLITLMGTGEPGSELAILIDTTEVARVTVGDNGEWAYEGALPELSNGSYILRTVALDATGGFTDDGAALAFVIGAADVMMDDAEPSDTDSMMSDGERPDDPVPAVALSDDRFSTLVSALQAIGLDDALSGDSPITVFAPTNEAFEKWPDGELEVLIRHYPEVLAEILQYHVVDGELPASDVVQTTSLGMLTGDSVQVTTSGDTVTVNDATIVQADVLASNGVIHAIDTVLLPPYNGAAPVIMSTSNSSQGSTKLLTVSGTGEPGLKMLVELNGTFFGEALVGADGAWVVSSEVAEAGSYEIVAFECTYNEILLAVSTPVQVVVE